MAGVEVGADLGADGFPQDAVGKTFQLTVSASDIDVYAETANLSLYLTSNGRSNNEAHPEVWEDADNNISCTLTDFNFVSDGWITDSDGFTNAEEFAAGTDPSDKKSHPDYFDSLKLVMPLKETVLPFYLRSYMKTPNGMKLEFFDPKRRNDYGKSGYRYSVLVGEPIGDTGFVAKGFEQKERKQQLQKLRTALAACEKEINEKETASEAIDEEMAKPEVAVE